VNEDRDAGDAAPVASAPSAANVSNAANAANAATDGAAGRRPLVERLGLAAVATLLAAVFAFVGLAAWTSGEVFLAVMAAIGALMTVWAAASTLRRS
jgi:1,4-dihydroxy-2-naphthoate octaprenyltransferase